MHHAPTPAAEATDAPTSTGRISRISYRWVAMGVLLFGTFMVVLDTTVVNLALPALQREFGTVEGVEWVVTAYLATVGVSQLCVGWASDRYGRKNAFVFALATFTIASALCALSVSLPMLVAARALQGVGGGLLMPVAMATIYELFEPEERGRALSYWGIALMVAPAIGPVLGGGLVSAVGWRWLFFINLPIGVAGLPLARRILRDTGVRDARALDRHGLVLSAAGIAVLMVGFARGSSNGWGDPMAIAAVAGAGILLSLFTRHVLGARAPLVDLRIFANPVFAVSMTVAALTAVAQYTRLVYVPLELGTVREISEARIGLVLVPAAVGMAAVLPLGGRMVDRVGARLPVSIGISVLAVSFVGLAALQPTTPLWVVSAILLVGGIGSGLAVMAPYIQAMNAISEGQLSQATGLSSVTRQLSAGIGTACVASLFAIVRPDGPVASISAGEALVPYRTVFLVAVGLLVVVLLVAQLLPGQDRARVLQQDRQAEVDQRRHEEAQQALRGSVA